MTFPKVSVDDNNHSVKIEIVGAATDIQWIGIKGLRVDWGGAYAYVRQELGYPRSPWYTVYSSEEKLIKGVSRFVVEIYEAQKK